MFQVPVKQPRLNSGIPSSPFRRQQCLVHNGPTNTQLSSINTTDVAVSLKDVNLTLRPANSRDTTPAKRILQGLSVDIPSGTLHMLLGANGCGKSTVLRLLAGLLKADSGSISLQGPSALVFQNPDHQVVMPTVAADVAFGLGQYDLPPAAAQALARSCLDRVGLSDVQDRPSSSLSGGQKQRVAIAGALAESPRLLLLDELTTFLDHEDQLSVLRCVKDIVKERETGSKVTAIWVTHRLEELGWADLISYMDGGRIAFIGTPHEMKLYMKSLGAIL